MKLPSFFKKDGLIWCQDKSATRLNPKDEKHCLLVPLFIFCWGILCIRFHLAFMNYESFIDWSVMPKVNMKEYERRSERMLCSTSIFCQLKILIILILKAQLLSECIILALIKCNRTDFIAQKYFILHQW